ncbi:MAG: hypothetical protein PHV47_00870, partial [Candidatus Pacebacteria bacterium]|nr:hypothetical protein [Candidatus Paceibacterota bacterium]
MEKINIVQEKTSLRKIILMMISILTLVLLINFVFISFGHAIIIDGGSSGCPSCCTNECSSGQKRCSSTTGYQTCGNYDSDSCYEWG